jgi:hypothetical protein
MMPQPKRGLVFTHRTIIDPADYRLPVREARKAPMRITAVRRDAVYFTYASEPANRGAFHMGRQEWQDLYGEP